MINWSFLLHSVTKMKTRVHCVVIMKESTRLNHMTTAAIAPKARKTTTRKPKAAAVKSVAPQATTPKRPSAAKLIPLSRYVQDTKQRWAIHEYEVMMLANDLQHGYKATSSYVKASYERAFN